MTASLLISAWIVLLVLTQFVHEQKQCLLINHNSAKVCASETPMHEFKERQRLPNLDKDKIQLELIPVGHNLLAI